MKRSLYLLAIVIAFVTKAQISNGYYDGTEGLTGYALKTKLHQIISNGAQDLGYGGLWTTYYTSDRDKYYENNNTLLDMYSEIPSGPDYHEFTVGDDQCGSTTQNYEGYCYNREHTLPRTYFGGQVAPMNNDAHFIIPTDYYVNNRRQDFPYGEVGSASYTSNNGSKVGNNKTPGYSGSVFEPIDEFKGDIARMQLYFVTRYEDKLSSFTPYQTSASPLDGSTNRGLKEWYLNVLLKWAAQDPVSQSEIDRNNAIYARQGNRNPFIDHPEWVTEIWGVSPLAVDDASFSKQLTIVPNPVKGNTITISGDLDLKKFKKVFIYNMIGQNVQTIDSPFENSNTIILNNLPKGVYILKTGELNTKFIIE